MKRSQLLLFVIFIGTFFLNVHLNEPIGAKNTQGSVQLIRVQQVESCTFLIAKQPVCSEVFHRIFLAIDSIRLTETLQIYHDRLNTYFYVQQLDYLEYKYLLKQFIPDRQSFLKEPDSLAFPQMS